MFLPLCFLVVALPEVAQAEAEVCDGVDNNGDGSIDEGATSERYVVQYQNGTIWKIDPVTGNSTPHASGFSLGTPNGLAGGGDSTTMYALTSSRDIWALNLVTKRHSKIAYVGDNGGCSGLALDADNYLWCVQRSTNRLVRINPADGTRTFAPYTAGYDTHHGGMAYSLNEDQLYMLNTNTSSDINEGILRFDRSTGKAQLLHNINWGAGAFAYDDESNLFYIGGNGGSGNGVYVVDPSNGNHWLLTNAYTSPNLTFFNLSEAQVWYADNDGDGFGDSGNELEACAQDDGSAPDGYVANSADSDDTDPNTCRDADDDGADDCAPEITDSDGDGVEDDDDNCVDIPNPSQANLDGDDLGDACDPDVDGDGDLGSTDCDDFDPLRYHSANEICADGVDNDCDGLTDADDDGADCDADGVLNGVDNCSLDYNPGQEDLDNDGAGDACDDDDDADGVEDLDDNCPVVANHDQDDFDGDGVGDSCDADGDGDGVDDFNGDLCHFTVATDLKTNSGFKGLGKNRWADIDGNGTFDTSGKNPTGRAYTMSDTAGCSCAQIIAICGYGKGHVKFGCSHSVMDVWTGTYDAADGAVGSCKSE